jgi:hypothetical protein
MEFLTLVQKQQERFDELSLLPVSKGGLLADVPNDYEPLDYDPDAIKSLMLQNAREIYEDLEDRINHMKTNDESTEDFKEIVLQIIKTKKDVNI